MNTKIKEYYKSDKSIANSIEDRLSQDIVFALVGPICSGVSSSANCLKRRLEQDFGYTVAPIIKPSDIIKEKFGLSNFPSNKTADYISKMQDFGNNLREEFGNDYLIKKSIEKIRIHKEENNRYSGNNELPGRSAYIIDSLKNISEYELLRSIYQDTLCVIGIFAPDELRKKRLKNIGYSEEEISKVIKRDQGELATFGQETRKLFIYSDFFVCNDQVIDELEKSLHRFLDIIFNTAIHTPTRSEFAMYTAYAASLNSACMSRQVGASILSDRDELIAVGWNDVPKFGGGLYSDEDIHICTEKGHVQNCDHRCYNWKGGKCQNDIKRLDIIENITNEIIKIGSDFCSKKEIIKEKISNTRIKSLIEFSRSIHAEMEAILSVAREGRQSLLGSTLYTNTYPCHNCARHIVASGIKEVVYIEPYLKSLAVELHEDVISEVSNNNENRVIFRQFTGVSPYNYLKLFKPKNERKNRGRLDLKDRKIALPVFQVPLDARRDYEDKVIADLADKEQGIITKDPSVKQKEADND